jgi:hypothetical protein
VGQLLLGVILVGIGVALMIRAGLGVASWDVLHVGLSRLTGWSIGSAAWVVGVGALALGTLLGQRSRRGTVVPLLVVGRGRPLGGAGPAVAGRLDAPRLSLLRRRETVRQRGQRPRQGQPGP